MPASLIGAEALEVERRGVDVDAADLAVARRGWRRPSRTLSAMNVGVVARVLAEDQDEPLVPLALERQHLPAHLRRGRACARTASRVAAPEAAVGAVVDALVADVERREQHDAVAVDRLLELPRGGEDLLDAASGSSARSRTAVSSTVSACLARLLAMISRTRAGVGRAPLEQAVQARVVDEVDGAWRSASSGHGRSSSRARLAPRAARRRGRCRRAGRSPRSAPPGSRGTPRPSR